MSDLLVDALEASGQFAWISDGEGKVIDVAGATEEVLGWTKAELCGRTMFDIVHPADLDRVRRRFTMLVGGRAPIRDFEVRAVRRDGTVAVLRIGGMAMRDGADGPRYLAVASDITRQRQAERELERERRRFARTFENAPGGIVLLHIDPVKGGRICRANRVACEIAGRTEEQLIGRWLADGTLTESTEQSLIESLEQSREVVMGEAGSFTLERVLKRPDGQRRYIKARVSGLDEGPPDPEDVADLDRVNAIVHIEDITEQRKAELELRHMALHDSLTDLLNRRRFTEILGEALGQVRPGEPMGALLMLDLDSFKTVNDTYGHHAGDFVLEAVADVLRAHIRESDPIGRLGGDEFAVLLPKANVKVAERVAQGLIDALAAARVGIPEVAGAEFTPFASVGIVMLDDPDVSVDEVLRRGDRIMYEAKKRGGSSFAV